MFLVQRNIIPPIKWCHDPYLQNYDGCVPFELTKRGKIPPEEWQIDPQVTSYDNGETIGIILSSHGIIPPKRWMHDIDNIKDKNGNSIRSNLEEWGYEYKDGQFIHKYGVIKNINNKKFGKLLKCYFDDSKRLNPRKLIPPITFQAIDRTFAMYLASIGLDIPDEWSHDPYLRGYSDETVAQIIIVNKVNFQNEIMDRQFNQFPYYLQNRMSAKQVEQYNQTIRNMSNKLTVLEKWQIDPNYEYDRYQNTFGMYIASLNRIPCSQWQHDPLKANDSKDTVALILSRKGIIPPDNWMHDVDMKNRSGESIRSNLKYYGYVYYNKQFIFIDQDNIFQYAQINIEKDICQKCQNGEQQECVETNCKHKLCIQCFKEAFSSRYSECPVCKTQKWFYVIPKSEQN